MSIHLSTLAKPGGAWEIPDLVNVSETRVLVVIASYGKRNLEYLKKIIAGYQRMVFKTHIVVLSDLPKELGPNVEVVVGCPGGNPRALPFAHREIFAKRAFDYELFVYSEDDIWVTEQNLRAFLRMSPTLHSDEIAGYLRYEVAPDGSRTLPEAHGTAHWKPASIHRRDCGLIAEYSNEHAAFYVVHRAQLRAAMESGGFLVPPHEGRYDMLCAAATDIYTACGMHKVICIDHWEDFLIHHMTNQYVGKLGASCDLFRNEMGALEEIADQKARLASLCNLDTLNGQWAKSFDDACEYVMHSVPMGRVSVLSIGASNGREEQFWKDRGARVTALPLDAARGVVLQGRDLEVLAGTLCDLPDNLGGRAFDFVVVSNLLHLQGEPADFLRRCASCLKREGQLVMKEPNFEFLPTRWKRWKKGGRMRGLQPEGYRAFGMEDLRQWMAVAGLEVTEVTWMSDPNYSTPSGALSARQRLRNWVGARVARFRPGRLTSDHWIIRARRI